MTKPKNKPKRGEPYIEDGIGYIPLTQGRYAKCDLSEFDILKTFRWSFAKAKTHSDPNFGYAMGHINGKSIAMHRFLTNAPAGKHVDHINHDPLDNRHENLRVVSHAENMRNRRVEPASGASGVYKRGNKWIARFEIPCESAEIATVIRRDLEELARDAGLIE